MKQNIPMPVVVGVLAVLLVALAAFFVYRGANRENDGVDMEAANRIQMQMHQKLARPTSPEESEKAYHGGK